MSRVFSIIKICIATMLLIVSGSLYAQDAQTTETTTTTTSDTGNGPVTVQRHVITTTVPAAKETYVTPTGYVSCITVPAAWVGDTWIPSHKACTYQNSTQGLAWVDGYWSCAASVADTGECTNWVWVAAHWVKTSLYY